MANAYKHGTYGEFAASIGSTPVLTGTTPVYVGTAPVHLVKGYKDIDVVNMPVEIKNFDGAKKKLGYAEDWERYTLCEAFYLHFNNSLQNAGSIVAINVLDPEKLKKSTATTAQITFKNRIAEIYSDTIMVDTLAIADKVEGTDFETAYDFTKGCLVITDIGTTPITAAVSASYNEIDPTGITSADIIGGEIGGTPTGLACMKLVNGELGLVPNILCVPKYSEEPTVYRAMVQASQKINGHWDCMINVDIPLDGNETKELAIKWADDNDYKSERAKVYYPQWRTKDGKVYHLSVIATWLMLIVDSGNNDIPMETPSNKQIPAGRQHFGSESKNKGYDQQEANELNANGITTAIYWGGINVLWGNHTAAYKYGAVTDSRVIFDNSIRMMMHVTNGFQAEHGLTIDKPMTKAMAETIRNIEQAKVDALVSVGALIGEPVVEFLESDNSKDDLLEGNFTWSNKMTPTPPFKSGTMKVAYTDAGFSVYLGEGA